MMNWFLFKVVFLTVILQLVFYLPVYVKNLKENVRYEQKALTFGKTSVV